MRYLIFIGLITLFVDSYASRYALVIGNEEYVAVPSLHNLEADAEDMATELGFSSHLSSQCQQAGDGCSFREFYQRLAATEECA